MKETTTTNAAPTTQFGLTLGQKIAWGVALIALAVLVFPLGPFFNSSDVGYFLFLLYGLALGLLTWYIASGWAFGVELTPTEIRIREGGRQRTVVPLDKLSLVTRNGRNPLMPSVWLVLRGAPVGQEIPEKGVDPRTLELIEAIQKRNPGKKLTYVGIQAGYLRSVRGFVGELKRRIPPLTVDERLQGK